MTRSPPLPAAPGFIPDDVTPTRDSAEGILALEEGGPDLFFSQAGTRNHIGTIFGGRMVGQSLCAASRTVEDMPASSLHAYFLAPGRIDTPVEYRVTRLRDSRRFANRQIVAAQEGQTIFTMLCEFHVAEDSFTHQSAVIPDVPLPEELVTVQQFVRDRASELDQAVFDNFCGPLPIEMRPVVPDQYYIERTGKPVRDFWFRLSSAAAFDDPRLHQCLLAYATDYWLAGVSAAPHALPTNSRELLISSLDHAIWFHRPARCDDWLLHHTVSPTAGDGVALSQGQIFDRNGRLVASTAQEALLRRLGLPNT